MVNKIHHTMLEDWHVKAPEIAKKVNISNEHAFSILHEHLSIKKLLARLVPRWLTTDEKQTHVTISKQCLDKLECNSSKFLQLYITIDETWTHYHTPEMKEQSKTTFSEHALKKMKKITMEKLWPWFSGTQRT